MEEFNQEEGSVVLKCQNEECGIENPADSIFCRRCGAWLVRQWQAVVVRGRSPLEAVVGVGPRRTASVSRHLLSATAVEIGITVLAGRNLDIVAYIENGAGSRVAGDSTRRIKRSETISYQTVEPGEYRLVLDNSFSYYTSKLVRLRMQGF